MEQFLPSTFHVQSDCESLLKTFTLAARESEDDEQNGEKISELEGKAQGPRKHLEAESSLAVSKTLERVKLKKRQKEERLRRAGKELPNPSHGEDSDNLQWIAADDDLEWVDADDNPGEVEDRSIDRPGNLESGVDEIEVVYSDGPETKTTSVEKGDGYDEGCESVVRDLQAGVLPHEQISEEKQPLLSEDDDEIIVDLGTPNNSEGGADETEPKPKRARVSAEEKRYYLSIHSAHLTVLVCLIPGKADQVASDATLQETASSLLATGEISDIPSLRRSVILFCANIAQAARGLSVKSADLRERAKLLVQRKIGGPLEAMVVLAAALRWKGLRTRTVASLIPVSHRHSVVNQSVDANTEHWCEVFLSGRWIPASAVNGSVDKVQSMFAKTGTPKRRGPAASSERKRSALHTHVIACERGRYYDVTPRYNKEWHKVQAHRAPDNLLGELLKRLSVTRTLESPDSGSEADKVELEGIALSEPLPTSQAAYVNHPRFALEKHLLKFEILHPKEPVLGYCSGLPVYPRRCVHTLRSKERWIREMRIVRDDAEPVKLMAARKGSSREGQQIELFGFWQTNKYVPPFAFDGIVPKDENNKLDIWTPEHVPGGCVHVKMKYAAQMARRLQIDYAVAMTGFDKLTPEKSTTN
ncbi:hypothetical protein NDN08_000425 [Rhodosorus marinus]|uniref:Transglutaminase-like domain-containing protein n=1 Tax=Rhodosorus marinus TaxID=101924 RepID=A0AAV8US43_9RHOD|nr:hypothetical protein NDN08_000425 [Rhodosorus marinus]